MDYPIGETVGNPDPLVQKPKWVTVPPAGIIPPQAGAVTVMRSASLVTVPLQVEVNSVPEGSRISIAQSATATGESLRTATV